MGYKLQKVVRIISYHNAEFQCNFYANQAALDREIDNFIEFTWNFIRIERMN